MSLDGAISGSTFDGVTFERGISVNCQAKTAAPPLVLTSAQILSPDIYNGFRVDGSGYCNLDVSGSTVTNLMLSGQVSNLKIRSSTVIGGRANDGNQSRPRGGSCTSCDFNGTVFSNFDFSVFTFAGADVTGMRLDGSKGFPGAVSGLGTVAGLETVTGY
ncbi:MAG: hypothetical protein Q8P18_19505 [Pseudomonadota bacterium]|nr:hypothetical protein [Pseudomonadota bacterium]